MSMVELNLIVDANAPEGRPHYIARVETSHIVDRRHGVDDIITVRVTRTGEERTLRMTPDTIYDFLFFDRPIKRV